MAEAQTVLTSPMAGVQTDLASPMAGVQTVLISRAVSSPAANLMGQMMATWMAEAGKRDAYVRTAVEAPFADRAKLSADIWNLYGKACVDNFWQMRDSLGSAVFLLCIRSDVRDPRDVWVGLLLTRILAAFADDACTESLAVRSTGMSMVAFFACKLVHACEENWPARVVLVST